jgi:hypothetical protein
MLKLPKKDSDEGAETRILLAECRGPSVSGYNLADATTCMQLMDRVLWNRVHNKPSQFLAKHPTLIGVITAPGQFQGFQNYPNYDSVLVHRLQQMVDIANSTKDKRSGDFTDFINAAISISGAPSIDDPSNGLLAAWRTADSGSPGSNFTLYKTVLATDFYYMESD